MAFYILAKEEFGTVPVSCATMKNAGEAMTRFDGPGGGRSGVRIFTIGVVNTEAE